MILDEYLFFISQNMQDAIILVENNIVIYYTKSLETMFRNKLNNICDIKKDISNLLCNEHSDVFKNYSPYEEANFRFKVNLGNNIYKWINMKSTPINNRAIITLSDITESVEEEKIQNQSRLNFISNVTHEFKTPLNLIFSSIQLLNKEIDINGSCKHEHLKLYLDLLNQNSYRILKLVNNISDDTKLDSGHHTYNPSNGDIVYFIESICQSIVSLVNLNSMDIIFDTDIEELKVAFDIEKMEKIILNLLSNSIKFRKSNNGNIMIELSHDKEYVNIKVRDNGIGIKEEHLNNVFAKYSRINDENSLIREGCGIGLSLVRDFVELHSGRITVDSKYGEWTEFNIKIPNKTVIESETSDYKYEDSRIEKIKVEFSDIYKECLK